MSFKISSMEVAAPIILHPRLKPFNLIKPTPYTHLHRTLKVRATNNTDNESAKTNINSIEPSSLSSPLDSVEIRFRRGSRRQYKEDMDGSKTAVKQKEPPKKWEEMSIPEKAMELYVGEKGLLFWLNKFAYASIFIMIGLWIFFRFVGPALNLYQLDTPPLAPTSVFKGA